jgi:hypothetical protein
VNFRRAEPTCEYRALRLLSEGGRWELGLTPYRNGTRIRMGAAGRPPSVIDFCLGHDTRLLAPALLAIAERLRGIPESAAAEEIDAAFPWAGTRPDAASHLGALLGGEVQKRGPWGESVGVGFRPGLESDAGAIGRE